MFSSITQAVVATILLIGTAIPVYGAFIPPSDDPAPKITVPTGTR